MNFFKMFLILVLLSFNTYAGVNLKNGNFYISYTDIVVPGGGHDLEIVRTYNSKSTDNGFFGIGWGTAYETYLVPAADGSVVVHENGAGALTRFTPKVAVNAEAAAKKIVDAMRKRSALSQKAANDLIKKLKNDAELRQAYARRFEVKARLAAGTVLYSNTRGLQQLHVVKSGYKRVYNDGKEEYFSKVGKLTKIKDKNGYTLKFVYNKDGNLKAIKDSQSKQLFFSWYPDKKVKEIWSAGDKKTFYTYKGHNLVQSKDVAGNIFKYTYDNNHNMTQIAYTDYSKMSIKYTRKTQFVEKVTSRNGESTEYKYDQNPKNPEFHYWTKVTKKTKDGKAVSSNRYEYEIKTRPDGSQYTYRIATQVNEINTETIYSECCGLPLKITRGKHVTNFEYNSKGLLTKKTSTKGTFVQLDYHKKLNKITKVVNNDGWTSFSYDKKGNLSKAVNSGGKSVLLIYDRRGRITKMVDYAKAAKKKRTLSFTYNALGKPVEIAMSKVGKINVAYDNYGEIKKVESKAGHKMALQVTQAFQSLLAIVKPAGVNLNM
ncbi:MAG: RHS repeat protein [Bacteriovoracaceae bacterium]|nr:RHS repeat protein [Bacteriovoracaceae bacterium]